MAVGQLGVEGGDGPGDGPGGGVEGAGGLDIGGEARFLGSVVFRFVSELAEGFTRLNPRSFLVVQTSRLSRLTSVCSPSISITSSLLI